MKSKKMKAMISTGYGGPDVLKLKTVNKPIPNKDEVLVRIHAVPVTTAETMMRTGLPLIGRLYLGLTKPKNSISGACFAGVIEEIGNEVTMFKPGDEVFGESLEKFGTYAEYLCIQEDAAIVRKPENISFSEASVAGDGHVTSYNFLKNIGKVKHGDNVLIIGASGSLGTAAVQLAKHFGAYVTGVCGSGNMDLVKSLGADQVIDYTKVDFTQNGECYDVIYDTVGKSSFTKCKGSLTTNGIYMSPVLDFSLLFQMLFTSFKGGKKAMFSATGMLPTNTIISYLKEIKTLMKMNKLKSIISQRYPLEQIPDVHRFIDSGRKKGNIVIEFNS